MEGQGLITALKSGRIAEEHVSRWTEIAPLMAVLDAIGRDGTSAVVKIDGERPIAVYTVVVSGKKLGESFFRKDGSDLVALLQDAIEYYEAEVWSKKS